MQWRDLSALLSKCIGDSGQPKQINKLNAISESGSGDDQTGAHLRLRISMRAHYTTPYTQVNKTQNLMILTSTFITNHGCSKQTIQNSVALKAKWSFTVIEIPLTECYGQLFYVLLVHSFVRVKCRISRQRDSFVNFWTKWK